MYTETQFSEAKVTNRLHAIAFLSLFIAPLLFAQNSQSNNSQPADISGAWQISWEGRGGSQQATMQVQQDGSKLSGTFEDESGSSQLTGTIAGNKVSLSVQIPGRSMTVALTGTVDGDKMSGTFQPQGGGGASGGRGGHGGAQTSHSWSGVRQQ
jgi:hypothetical protein